MEENTKMKILVLSHISELLGGAERSMLDVFDYLTKHYDVQPTFILRQPLKSLVGELKRRGWDYYGLDYTFWSDGNPPKHAKDIALNAEKNLRAVQEIEKIIQNIDPDIVMTNSVVCPWAALAAYKTKMPHVWFVREYGDLDHGRIYEIGRKKTLEDVGNLSQLVVTNSITLADHVKKYVSQAGRVTTLYNPFDIPAIKAKSTQKVPNPFTTKNALKLVITGNLAPSKGQHEIIQAVAQLNKKHNVELCVIGKSGDPNYSKQVEDIISNEGLVNKIHLIGYQSNPLAYIKHADVCIMASRKEAFGRVTFEYLVAGKPIIGADSGATPEMVKDGQNGYLYKFGDMHSLITAINRYLENPELINKHALASRELAGQMMKGEFNIDNLYKKISTLPKTYKPEHKTIHYLNYLEEQAQKAKNFPHNQDAGSLKSKIKRRGRRHARSLYLRVRSAKARLTGK